MDEEIEEIEGMEASLARQQENMAWRRCGFRSKGDYVIKTMARRYAMGEFGGEKDARSVPIPPNFDLVGYNEAMKQMIDEDIKKEDIWKEDRLRLSAHPLFCDHPLFSQARAVTMKFDKLNTVCSLRTKKELLQFRKGASGCIGAEVLFECEELQKEVVIPEGVKVLVLKHSKRNSKPGPDGSVVYVTEESHGGKRPDDTAKIENAMRETADPLPFAPGEWQGDP